MAGKTNGWRGGDRHYGGLLDQAAILELFRAGRYSADLEAGRVYGANGAELASYPGKSGHLFIRLYGAGRRKAIAIHRVIWIVASGLAIPRGFEIHHRNKDVTDNAWANLFCLAKPDHAKLHGRDLVTDAAPF